MIIIFPPELLASFDRALGHASLTDGETPRVSRNSRSAACGNPPSKNNSAHRHERVYVFVLVDGSNKDYPLGWGNADSPSDGPAVQALRNARLVEGFAHGS